MESNLAEMLDIAKESCIAANFEKLLMEISYLPQGDNTDVLKGYVGTTSRLCVTLTMLTESVLKGITASLGLENRATVADFLKMFLGVAASMNLREENRDVARAIFSEDVIMFAESLRFPDAANSRQQMIKDFIENLQKAGIFMPKEKASE